MGSSYAKEAEVFICSRCRPTSTTHMRRRRRRCPKCLTGVTALLKNFGPTEVSKGDTHIEIVRKIPKNDNNAKDIAERFAERKDTVENYHNTYNEGQVSIGSCRTDLSNNKKIGK